MAEPITVILSTDRSPGSQQRQMERDLTTALAGRPGLNFQVMPHLYDLKPEGRAVEALRSVEGDMIVLGWIYPRAMYWVLDANRVRGRMGRTSLMGEEEPAEPVQRSPHATDLTSRTIWCMDLRQHEEAGPYLEEIERLSGIPLVPQAAPAAAGRIEEETVPRWYPVIDFARCTNCLECLNFCLFGVFGLDEAESITVEQADACRNGCPACSRICPAGAIMFPQHGDSAIAGNGTEGAAGLRLDLSQLFAGADPSQVAAAQRERALAEQEHYTSGTKRSEPDPPEDPGELDRLVDEVDDLDL